VQRTAQHLGHGILPRPAETNVRLASIRVRRARRGRKLGGPGGGAISPRRAPAS
jgi:hypothetical protein